MDGWRGDESSTRTRGLGGVVNTCPDDRCDGMLPHWRILVCGTRWWGGFAAIDPPPRRPTRDEWMQAKVLFAFLDGLRSDSIIDPACTFHVVTGDASGADAIARWWAERQAGVELVVFDADWKQHGRAAGPIRNKAMVETLDPENVHHFVVAAWDGVSRGTGSTIDFAVQRGLKVVRLGVQ